LHLMQFSVTTKVMSVCAARLPAREKKILCHAPRAGRKAAQA
jgi:hypothetical protein